MVFLIFIIYSLTLFDLFIHLTKYNNRTIEIAASLGYSKQYSSIPGFYIDAFGKNVKKRSLVQIADEKEFKAILKGGDHILAFWYKLKHFRT